MPPLLPLTWSLVSFSPKPSKDSPPMTKKKQKYFIFTWRNGKIIENYPYSVDWMELDSNHSIRLWQTAQMMDVLQILYLASFFRKPAKQKQNHMNFFILKMIYFIFDSFDSFFSPKKSNNNIFNTLHTIDTSYYFCWSNTWLHVRDWIIVRVRGSVSFELSIFCVSWVLFRLWHLFYIWPVWQYDTPFIRF